MTSGNTITQISSFSELRSIKPTAENQRVELLGWNAGSFIGGGIFIGHIVNNRDVKQKADDGGIVAAGKGYYWERVVNDLSKLTVVEWGALVDGQTDAAPAAYAMHKWTLGNCAGLGIQLPSGRIYISSLSFPTESNFFRLSGAPVEFGYFANTTIVTDNQENFLLDVYHRWVELSYLRFDGRSSDKTGRNTKGIFRNKVIGGQYFRGKCINFKNVGGTCLSLIDTLDTKIDQWYVSTCTGDVLVNKWSDRKEGSWNHTTAVELTNFNIQNVRGGKVFDMQRCTQSMMQNGWIEHCDNPGDISGGGWRLLNLSMEDCNSKLKAANCKLVEVSRNIHGKLSGIDYTAEPENRWLSEWERGRVDIDSNGIFVNGSLEPGTIMSRHKLSNPDEKPNWFRFGNFFIPEEGDSLDINFIGTGNFLSKAAIINDVDDVRQGGGNTLVRIQIHNQGNINGTLMPFGSSPLLAAKLVKTGGGRVEVYVQLKGYTRNVIPVITSTSKTRFEAGVSYYFEPNIQILKTEDELKVLNTCAAINEQWSIGQSAGVGATNEGHLVLKGKIVGDHLAVQVKIAPESWGKPELRYIPLLKEPK